jgi:hypothetical protein
MWGSFRGIGVLFCVDLEVQANRQADHRGDVSPFALRHLPETYELVLRQPNRGLLHRFRSVNEAVNWSIHVYTNVSHGGDGTTGSSGPHPVVATDLSVCLDLVSLGVMAAGLPEAGVDLFAHLLSGVSSSQLLGVLDHVVTAAVGDPVDEHAGGKLAAGVTLSQHLDTQ